MKKLLTSAILVLAFILQLYSQIPEKFNYQGVLRNSSGELVKNTSITVKVSLLQGSTSGSVVYSENHTVTTNNYGQFAVQVGGGTVLSGTFSNIDWSQQMYQKTEVANPAGGTLVDMGTVQLVSVPYALYAKNVENKDDADADGPIAAGQQVQRSISTAGYICGARTTAGVSHMSVVGESMATGTSDQLVPVLWKISP